jgi:hypothetical protein
MMKFVHIFRSSIYLVGIIGCLCGALTQCQNEPEREMFLAFGLWPPDLVPHPPHFPTPPPSDPLA